MERVPNVWQRELSYNERAALAYAPKVAALVAAVTSTWAAIVIIRNKEKMAKMYHRLALGLCISSTVKTSNIIATSWLIPSDEEGYVHAWGNVQTCTFTGFMNQLGFVVQYYYVCLSIYVFMSLRCEFRIKEIEWMEKYLHFGVFIFPLGSAIFLTTQKMFNSIGVGCWINASPFGCGLGRQEGPCHRGVNDHRVYVISLGILPTAFNLFFASTMIILCYINEQQKFEKVAKKGFLQGKRMLYEHARQKKSMLIKRQGAIYLAVFYSSYLVAFVAVVVNSVTEKLFFPTLMLAALCYPIDAFFFTLSYLFLQNRNNDCELSNLNGKKDLVARRDHQRRKSFAGFSINTGSIMQKLESTDSTKDKLSRSRQSWTAGTNTTHIESLDQQVPKRRASGVYVSLFDGTDEDKWKQFGVYVGSESESEYDSDFELEKIEEAAKRFSSR